MYPYYRHDQYGINENSHSHIPCILLCAMLFLILGFLPSLPSAATQLFRPVIIIVCFLIPAKHMYPASITDRTLMAYLCYFLLVFWSHPITQRSALSYAAVLLFGLFFIVVARYDWSKEEIRIILFTVSIACSIFAIILFRENPNMLHNHPYGGFTFRGVHINDNTAAYGLAPGVLTAIALSLFHKSRRKKTINNIIIRLVFLGLGMFCAFVMFCIGARSAFASIVIGVLFLFYQKTCTFHSVNLRMNSRLLMIVCLFVFFQAGSHITEGTHSARLFDLQNYSDTNGRDDLADEAWPMIHKKPMFGGGFDYWEMENGNELGTHNTFLTIMVRGGYVGALFLCLFLLSAMYEVFQSKNFLLGAFTLEPLFHTFSESDLNYYVYIPLLITFILLRYSNRYKIPVEEII